MIDRNATIRFLHSQEKLLVLANFIAREYCTLSVDISHMKIFSRPKELY